MTRPLDRSRFAAELDAVRAERTQGYVGTMDRRLREREVAWLIKKIEELRAKLAGYERRLSSLRSAQQAEGDI